MVRQSWPLLSPTPSVCLVICTVYIDLFFKIIPLCPPLSPLLILVVLEFSNEDKSINLKSLPGSCPSEIQQGPTTSNPIPDSGSYHVPQLSTGPSSKPFPHYHYSTIQTHIVYNPNPCARPASEIQQALAVYLITELGRIIFLQFHPPPLPCGSSDRFHWRIPTYICYNPSPCQVSEGVLPKTACHVSQLLTDVTFSYLHWDQHTFNDWRSFWSTLLQNLTLGIKLIA